MDVLAQDRREGLGRRVNSRFVLILLLVVSAILLLSSLYAAEASVFKRARERVIDASSVVLPVFSGPIALVQDVVGSVRDYFGVLEENKALREENAELRQWMAEARELRRTIAAYESLQGYRAPPEALPIDAFVIGETNDVYARSMIVNAGRRSGVDTGLAVVDDRGLVGHIVDAGAEASRVLLLTDIQSRIPVYVEEAEVQGILIGRLSARPVIEFVANSEPSALERGQRVLTSGAGGVVPRGLPVGVIADPDQAEATVDLDVNYARTRMVRVINYDFPQPDEPGDETLAEPADAGAAGDGDDAPALEG